MKVKINAEKDLANFRLRVKTLKLQLLQFQAITVRSLANSIILDEIHNRMRQFEFSEKIINNTIVSDIKPIGMNKVRIFFHSEYFSEKGFDVALAVEKGTKDHWIFPKGTRLVGSVTVSAFGGIKKKLKIEHGEHSLHWIENGKSFFSKGHKVSGILALKIIENTVKDKKEELQKQFNNAMVRWTVQNLKGARINAV